jgi:hypothetical protein
VQQVDGVGRLHGGGLRAGYLAGDQILGAHQAIGDVAQLLHKPPAQLMVLKRGACDGLPDRELRIELCHDTHRIKVSRLACDLAGLRRF